MHAFVVLMAVLSLSLTAADRVVQPVGGGIQVSSTLFQPNLQSSVGAVASGFETIYATNSSAIRSVNGVGVALAGGSYAIGPQIINSTGTQFQAAVEAGTGTAFLEQTPEFVANRAFTPSTAESGSLLTGIGTTLKTENVVLSPTEPYLFLLQSTAATTALYTIANSGSGSSGLPGGFRLANHLDSGNVAFLATIAGAGAFTYQCSISGNVAGNVSLYILSQTVAKDLITSQLNGLGTRVLPQSVIPAGGSTSNRLTDLTAEDTVVAVQYTSPNGAITFPSAETTPFSQPISVTFDFTLTGRSDAVVLPLNVGGGASSGSTSGSTPSASGSTPSAAGGTPSAAGGTPSASGSNTGSTGAIFIPQPSTGIPASASATQAASGATQSVTSSTDLLGSPSAITPLPATANQATSAQGPNGQINLQPAVQGQPQNPSGGGVFANTPAGSTTQPSTSLGTGGGGLTGTPTSSSGQGSGGGVTGSTGQSPTLPTGTTPASPLPGTGSSPVIPGVTTPSIPGITVPSLPGFPSPNGNVPAVPSPTIPNVPSPTIPTDLPPINPGSPTPNIPNVPSPTIPNVPGGQLPLSGSFPLVPTPNIPGGQTPDVGNPSLQGSIPSGISFTPQGPGAGNNAGNNGNNGNTGNQGNNGNTDGNQVTSVDNQKNNGNSPSTTNSNDGSPVGTAQKLAADPTPTNSVRT